MSNPLNLSFLGLPAEIRNKIYAYALVDYRREVYLNLKPNLKAGTIQTLDVLLAKLPCPVLTNLLHTSRQIYHEALSTFYKDNHFRLRFAKSMAAPTKPCLLAPTFSVQHFKLIRHLTVSLAIQELIEVGLLQTLQCVSENSDFEVVHFDFDGVLASSKCVKHNHEDSNGQHLENAMCCMYEVLEVLNQGMREDYTRRLVDDTCAIKVSKELYFRFWMSDVDEEDFSVVELFVQQVVAQKNWDFELIRRDSGDRRMDGGRRR